MTSSNGNIFRVTGHLCGEFTGPGEFHSQTPVTRSFNVFFDLCLNKRLSKQSWGWWFETLPCPIWRHCNAFLVLKLKYSGRNLVLTLFRINRPCLSFATSGITGLRDDTQCNYMCMFMFSENEFTTTRDNLIVCWQYNLSKRQCVCTRFFDKLPCTKLFLSRKYISFSWLTRYGLVSR